MFMMRDLGVPGACQLSRGWQFGSSDRCSHER